MKHFALLPIMILIATQLSAQEICVDSVSGAATKLSCTNNVANISAIAQSANILNGATSSVVKYAVINVDGADADVVIAAVAAKKFRVLGYTMNCDGAGDVTFEDGDGTDVTGAIPFAANGSVSAAVSALGQFQTPVANKALSILKSAAVSCDGHLTYIQID